jgi:hypothetical protein
MDYPQPKKQLYNDSRWCQNQAQGLKGMARKTKIPHCKDKWMTSDFFDKPYNWCEPESRHGTLASTYKEDKATYDAFYRKKISQIPVIKHMTTKEAIQHIKKKKLEVF